MPCSALPMPLRRTLKKITQWKAFLNKNKLESDDVEDVVLLLRTFLMLVVTSANMDNNWQAGFAWLFQNI